jgi:hypothetical protein
MKKTKQKNSRFIQCTAEKLLYNGAVCFKRSRHHWQSIKAPKQQTDIESVFVDFWRKQEMLCRSPVCFVFVLFRAGSA